MESLKLMGLCVACLLPVLLLKKSAPEQALLLTIAIVAVAVARCLSLAAPVVEELETLLAQAGIEGEYAAILLRSVAAALVTRLCAQLCRDGGSQALAGAVETAGAVAALLIALPLLRSVLSLLTVYFT
jgi:stage III sporulation protein AD